MKVIIIPKTFAPGDDIILMPRSEYEALKARAILKPIPARNKIKRKR